MELAAALGPLHEEVTRTIRSLATQGAAERVWSGDHTLWAPDPAEISDRLGWLHVLPEMGASVSELEMFAAGVKADGLLKAVICGMGGSTLFPEVLARTFRSPEGMPVAVLDTTDPAAVDRILSDREITDTLFVGSSKSGSTIETRSHIETFWGQLQRGSQFTVITDHGSDLVGLADRNGFRRVFLNRSDIGGRFSALSYFGLLPGALAGAPIAEILRTASEFVPALRRPESDNPGVILGTSLAVAAQSGRDKATLLLDKRIEHLAVWLEQLLAESTGKDGQGVVPIVNEPPSPEVYGDDRMFVVIGSPEGAELVPPDAPVIRFSLEDAVDIGAQVMLWEYATAIAGAVLGVNPFNQPNVESAKRAARELLASGPPQIPLTPVPELLARLRPGDYIAVCAYVDGESNVADRLRRKLVQLGQRLGVPTTFGIGPRYLHSTGQLHKGKPSRVLAIQVVAEDRTDVAIPHEPFSFGQLKTAQAAGDYRALTDVGARVGRVALTEFLDA
ncbi:MAG: glucose-6-phosphate isomerase [Acidimicrobiia bacterium]|nr:glucose-6-phosphate isomerase [Acidimicrobiia bacterium]